MNKARLEGMIAVTTPAHQVTIHDVAAAAQVSSATVSRVLNGNAAVSAALAERVRRAVDETGYVIDPVGRALRRRISPTWHMIIPDLQNQFFTAVVSAVEQVAGPAGYSVVLSNTDEGLDRERQAIATAVASRPSGIVLAAASETQTSLEPITKAGIALVLVDRRVQGYDGDAIYTDNYQSGRLAAEHLLARGRRRIGCIAGPVDVSATEDRLIGFRDRLEAAGIKLTDRWVRRSDLHVASGQAALRSLQDQAAADGESLDAVYVTNGPLTAGAFRELQLLGLSLPQDLALIGTDDDEWTRMVNPTVTVVRQPVERIGRLAGQTLAVRAEGGGHGVGPIMLAPNLEIRESA